MQPLPISPAKQVTQTPAGETLEPDKKHRITAIVEENVRPRVEKLRQASTNVLEEAAIDPSLRFLLIAIILIIISVVLILLSLIK